MSLTFNPKIAIRRVIKARRKRGASEASIEAYKNRMMSKWKSDEMQKLIKSL
jgi:hypothetical protein